MQNPDTLKNPKPKIIAHCGDQRNAPENTLPAFVSAIEKGADTIELDVQMSRDGVLVVHHDYLLGRTENATGILNRYEYEDLRQLDVGNWFGQQFKGTRIPQFAEVLQLGKGHVTFEIDLRHPDPDFLESVIRTIDKFELLHAVEFTSIHVPLLMRLKQLYPSAKVGLFATLRESWMPVTLWQEHLLSWMSLCNAQVAHVEFAYLSEELCKQVHNRGWLMHGANLNTAREIGQAVAYGIDQFSTDDLDLALVSLPTSQ